MGPEDRRDKHGPGKIGCSSSRTGQKKSDQKNTPSEVPIRKSNQDIPSYVTL